MMPIN